MRQQVFILAGGKHVRWETNRYPKELVTIAGELLLVRTCRQLCDLEQNDITIVTGFIETKRAMAGLAKTQEPIHRSPTVAGIIETMTSWKAERIIVLLGDVIFSDEVMRAIVEEDAPLQIYGDNGELFAVTFDRSRFVFVAHNLAIALFDARINRGRGMVWEFYRSCCGHSDLRIHRMESTIHRMVDDYTQDFDRENQYLSFLKKHAWARGVS